MNARGLAQVIESYLEADGTGDSSNGSPVSSSGTSVVVESATRQQLNQLSHTVDQLKQDNDKLQKEISSLKNNLQMSAIIPLLMNQSQIIDGIKNQFGVAIDVQDTGGASVIGDTITLKPADKKTMLIPLLLSAMTDGSGSDNSMLPLMLLFI